MSITNKTILIISPQHWGKMFISKHHYAIELARKGNKVYYLNPPDQIKTQRKSAIEIENADNEKNLFLISHRLFFPYNLKFHAIPLFHWLMRFHVQRLIKQIDDKIDIVWSFDLGNLYPFRLWGNNIYKIFHPVDEPLNKAAFDSARDSDIIFSVTQEILKKYDHLPAPKYFINHGLAANFLRAAGGTENTRNALHVGFAGNLLRTDIDRDTILKIVSQNPDIIFEFWGSNSVEQSNIGGGENRDTENFMRDLKALKNTILHGPVPANTLAKAIHGMDAFLICYDVNRDQSKGTNYHKIMEFMSTGKVIISNNVTTYNDQPDLIQMVESRENNNELPGLFKHVVANISRYNSIALQQKRISYAEENLYSRQIERIERILNI